MRTLQEGSVVLECSGTLTLLLKSNFMLETLNESCV